MGPGMHQCVQSLIPWFHRLSQWTPGCASGLMFIIHVTSIAANMTPRPLFLILSISSNTVFLISKWFPFNGLGSKLDIVLVQDPPEFQTPASKCDGEKVLTTTNCTLPVLLLLLKVIQCGSKCVLHRKYEAQYCRDRDIVFMMDCANQFVLLVQV